jgi:thioredoxin-related protein
MSMTAKMIAAVGVLGAVLGLLVWTSSSSAGGENWLGYSEAVKKAGEVHRIVLVDVYTDWCGWCKRMDRDVYGDPAVRAVLDEHFVVAKLDAESGNTHPFQGQTASEREIAKAYGITGYPTTVFLSEDGEPITILPGYIPKETFLKVLEYIHTRRYETQNWEEFIQSGKS